MNNDCTFCRVPFLVIQIPSVSLDSFLASSHSTVLYYSRVGAVLFELIELCACYDLAVLKYLSQPNNVVFL